MQKQTNETLKMIEERRSVRTFSEKNVSNDHLKKILDAANQAPSAHNQQSWRFVVVRGAKKAGLAALIAEKADKFPRASAALLRMASRSISSAPVVIAIANTGELIKHGARLFQMEKGVSDYFYRTMEIQSSSAAVENLLIAATSLGLGTVWLGIMCLIKEDILEYLGELKGEFMAIVAVGHPARPNISPEKRPLYKVVRFL